MLSWLLKSFGVNEEIVQHLDKARVAVQHPVLLGIGLVLLVPVAVYIFRRQQQNLAAVSPTVTVALSVTRVVIMALLLFVLCGPYLKLDYTREKKPIVALLLDQSASMLLPAGPYTQDAEALGLAKAAGYPTPDGKVDAETRKALNRVSRAKLAQNVLTTAGLPLLRNWAEKFDVRVYGFAAEPALLKVDPKQLQLAEPAEPGGPTTHLGDALGKVLDEAGGTQLAGILVFSDGQNTGGALPLDAAYRAASLGAPIYALPAGSSNVLQDVAVVDVNTSGQVALGDTARVTTTVESHGLDGKTAKIQLLEGDTVLDTKELTLRANEQQQIDLSFEATRAGPRYLAVNIEPLPEEPEFLRANNADAALVRVSQEKLRVLYLEGLPRWDFRFLKNAMRRDHGFGGRGGSLPDVVLESELRRRPPEQRAAAVPQTADELSKYHAIVLGDVSPNLLNRSLLDALLEAVKEHGVGLIVQAGPLFMPHAYPEEFTDLLPVRLHPRAAGVMAPPFRPFRLELTPNGALHEAMRLYDEPDRNRTIWLKMPPYYWSAAVERAAPGATVLAWNSSVGARQGALPLIAYHFAGEGKVLFVGTDSTWTWRENAGDRFFYRFWGQAIRFVARREESSRSTTLEVRPVRLQPHQEASVELLAFDDQGAPRRERKLTVGVFGEKAAAKIELVADESTRGRYLGKFVPEAAGRYRLAFDAGDNSAVVEARVRVMPASEELRSPGVNRPALQLLTGATGGKLVELPDLASLQGQLKGESKFTQVRREASLWDNWLTLTLLVLIYSFDVGLRRLRGLA